MKRILPIGSLLLALVACSGPNNKLALDSDAPADVKVAQFSKLGEESQAPVMRVDGKTLLDSSGKPVIIRGIEGWFGLTSQESDENMRALVDAIASQGFNAVRLQLLTDDLSKIEPLIQYSHSKGMVFYLNDDHMPGVDQERLDGFLAREDVKAMVERHRHNMVIDVTIEEPDDAEDAGAIEHWIQAQKDSIAQVRSFGYTQPLIIGTLNHGRYLRGLLDHASEIVESDPLKSIILNCQMYWGDYSGDFSYQGLSSYSEGDEGVKEAMRDVGASPYLFQIGIDAVDDGGNNAKVPYELLMIESERYGLGTMFWQWKDPGNAEDPNSLVRNQYDIATMTELGNIVINTNPASIRNTSHLVQDFPVSTAVPSVPETTDLPNGEDAGVADGATTAEPETVTNEPATQPDESTTEDALPDSCSEVAEEYRGDNEGCDCPADGQRSCDPDCVGAPVADTYCGCDYCYPELPSDDTTTGSQPATTSSPETSSPETSSPETESDSTQSESTEATETTEPQTFGVDTSELETRDGEQLPNVCVEVPAEYFGDGEGCDCPANGERGCDADCEGAGEADTYCGCDYCYPEEG